ncbi:MAG: hypothetical protein V1792_06420 [Pseudomonadota bacterium]
MSQSAFHASAGDFLQSYDFNQNYSYLKKLIQELKAEDDKSLKQALFGEDECRRTLTKKQMKQLFRFLRKIEHHYEECCTPPIPDELEKSIRGKESDRWLPWELEAIQKVDAWREEVQERKVMARRMFEGALEKVRNGEKLP